MSLNGRRILVTGAGGFIGSVVAGALQAAGAEISAGVRRSGPGRAHGVACNLDVPAEVVSAVVGQDGVVHAAYGEPAAMPGQMRNLLAAMTSAGCSRLVQFSSIAVYGDAEGKIGERHETGDGLDGYGRAKIACEAQVDAWSKADPRRSVVVLRPGIVYGRGSPFWITKLGRRIKAGAWGTFGPRGEGLCPLVHVDDVAGIVLAALERMLAEPGLIGTLNVVGPENQTWNAYFRALAAALGKPDLPELVGSTLKIRQAIAMIAKTGNKIGLPAPDRWALAPTPGEIALFSRDATYSTAALERLLGVRPVIGLAEGLNRSLP